MITLDVNTPLKIASSTVMVCVLMAMRWTGFGFEDKTINDPNFIKYETFNFS